MSTFSIDQLYRLFGFSYVRHQRRHLRRQQYQQCELALSFITIMQVLTSFQNNNNRNNNNNDL